MDRIEGPGESRVAELTHVDPGLSQDGGAVLDHLTVDHLVDLIEYFHESGLALRTEDGNSFASRSVQVFGNGGINQSQSAIGRKGNLEFIDINQ